MGDFVGIDEMDVHALGNVTWCHAIEAVGIDERVAFYHLYTVLESLSAQFLVVVNLWCFDKEVTAYDAVHQYGNTTMLARLADKLGQIVVEGGTWVGVTVGFGLFVVMAKLDDDVVTRLHAL